MSEETAGNRVWQYRPGPHWAVVGPTAAALLLGESGVELAERIWRLLGDADGAVDRVLDELARQGLAGLPPFALVEVAGTEVRALARGTGVTRVRTADDTHRTVSGVGVRSWREDTVAAAVDVVLADGGEGAPSGPRLPIGNGIVRAAELTLVVDSSVPGTAAEPVPVEAPPPAAAPVPAPVPVPNEPDPEPVDAALTLDDSDFDPDHGRHAAASTGPEPVAPPAGQDDEDAYLELVAGLTEIEVPPEQPLAAPQASAPEPVRPAEPPPSAAASPARQAGTPEPSPARHAPAPAAPRPAPAATPAQAPATPGVISSIPFRSGRAAPRPAAPPAAPISRSRPAPLPPAARPSPPRVESPATAGPDDDTNITVAKLSVDSSGGDSGSSGSRTGWLPAVVCGSGHANPPESERCRVCRADLSSAAHQWIERPVLGHLRFDRDVGVVEVAGPMVVGRKPRADGVPGDAVPTMITIPDDDLSRSHLRVSVEGWHVVITDLHATNGTWVYDPDGEGRRLDPDEQKPLLPGSRVVMAGTVGFVFEVQP